MNFSVVMQNLAIGIVGGIFSGIIVSIVFYILTNFQNEINEAEILINPVKMICVTWKYKETLKDGLDIDETIEEYWKKVLYGFNNYKATSFDSRLSSILSDIRDISLKPENVQGIQEKDSVNYIHELMAQLELYESYKKDFAKTYMLRIMKNKIIWIILVISIGIFIAA